VVAAILVFVITNLASNALTHNCLHNPATPDGKVCAQVQKWTVGVVRNDLALQHVGE
jgi:hypothetical protein